MSDQEKGTEAEAAATAGLAPARRFVLGGVELNDIDASMNPEQIRDAWAEVYPELQHAKVLGPENDETGAQVYTFTRRIGIARYGNRTELQ